MKALKVKFTQDRHGDPLCILRNLPGEDAEMTPARMRQLAYALIEAAVNCDLHYVKANGKHLPDQQREFAIRSDIA